MARPGAPTENMLSTALVASAVNLSFSEPRSYPKMALRIVALEKLGKE